MTEPKEKPKTASLFADHVARDRRPSRSARKLLSLPRVVGADPDGGEPIIAQNGRYGPYITRGKETRSLADEDQIFTVTWPRRWRCWLSPSSAGDGRAPPPHRELGEDPVTGKHVSCEGGRFGPYVTDGETNATLRRGEQPETISLDHAGELLAEGAPSAADEEEGTDEGPGQEGREEAPEHQDPPVKKGRPPRRPRRRRPPRRSRQPSVPDA